MTSSHPRLALKVDCDTFEGTQKGIPQLLRLFDKASIRATFFFTLGPDTSGRAVMRVFTRKGFLRKMLRSNAVALYGPKTMLYGTLLPAPMIGEKCSEVIRSVAAAGHEVGIHGWDHVRWHDRLDRMSEDQITRDVERAHGVFTQIFEKKAHAVAAPGWHVTPAYLQIQDAYRLLYASNTRGGSPCFLEADGVRFKTLEIPSTLPTWDEVLGTPEDQNEAAFIDYFRKQIRQTEVHSIHTEVEGRAYSGRFERQLDAWQADGVQFVTLEEVANEVLADRSRIPVRRHVRIAIPNRAGFVSSGAPSTRAGDLPSS